MIMTRKNLILLLFSLLTLNSCNKHEGPELRFCENYIQNYCQGDLVLLSRSPDRPPQIPADPQTPIRNFWIELTDCEWISPESDPQEFERLAIRNGDVGYNRWLEFWEYPSAFADNFQTMHITSDADWDEEHPAGKPLDDLFRVSVRSWKQRDEYGAPLLCRERMDRIGPEHLQMIPFNPKNPWDGRKNLRPIEIEPLAEPASEQHHRLTLTMTTTDGRTKSTSIDYPPKTGL